MCASGCSKPGTVKMTIYGGVVDMAYSRLLIQKTDLPLADVLALDRVQKKLPIPDEAATHLRKARLIEGRKPNYFVSAAVAAATGGKAEYIRNRRQDDAHYTKLITDYLSQFGQATRAEINTLLLSKLSDALTDEQKDNKIANLLTNLRRNGRICNAGSRGHPIWRLAE
jgi:ATP-dependent DNA helicase RecG